MTQVTASEYIQVPGKVEILVALPTAVFASPGWPLADPRDEVSAPSDQEAAYSTLFKLGESENDIEVRITPVVHEVKGDRHGGNEGPAIESQFLGLKADFETNMSRWDPEIVFLLEKMGGVMPTPGTVPLGNVGKLLHRDRCVRFLLYATQDPTLSLNFPCCIWNRPRTAGKGTKYEKCRFGVEAHRTPEGAWGTALVSGAWTPTNIAGVVYNRATTGVASPYVVT